MSLSAEEFRAHLELSAATACRMPDGRFMWKYDQRHRGRPADPDAYARRRELLWSAVDTVECPTLVVRGAQSDVFHDEDAEALASRLQRGRWVRIEGAGHTVQGDNPAGLLVALREFLAEATPPRPGARGGSPSARG